MLNGALLEVGVREGPWLGVVDVLGHSLGTNVGRALRVGIELGS